jgi:hypothetical protein
MYSKRRLEDERERETDEIKLMGENAGAQVSRFFFSCARIYIYNSREWVLLRGLLAVLLKQLAGRRPHWQQRRGGSQPWKIVSRLSVLFTAAADGRERKIIK